MLFEDAGSDPFQIVQLMKENPRKSWAAIEDYPDGVGTGVTRLYDARRTIWALLCRLLEEAAGPGAQTTTMKTFTLRARLKRPRVGVGKRAGEVHQEVVPCVILLDRLRSLAGWCVPGQVRRGLQTKPVDSTGAAATCV